MAISEQYYGQNRRQYWKIAKIVRFDRHVVVVMCVQAWIDYKLRWDPDQYGGVKVVRLPFDTIWKPDILLYNKSVSMNLLHNIHSTVRLNVLTAVLVHSNDGTHFFSNMQLSINAITRLLNRRTLHVITVCNTTDQCWQVQYHNIGEPLKWPAYTNQLTATFQYQCACTNAQLFIYFLPGWVIEDEEIMTTVSIFLISCKSQH